MTDYNALRRHMVEGQVRVNDVTDRDIIAALSEIPREIFTPKARRAEAYADKHVEIAEGRYMIRPRDFAKLLQAMEPKKTDIALSIACGRGYSCAVLSRLVETVVGLESDETALAKGGQALAGLDAMNAVMIEGDLKNGAPDEGPLDMILVNGAVTEPPKAWLDQICSGGRLGVFERRPGGAGRAVLYRRDGGAVGRRELFDADVPLLPGFEPEKAFFF